MVVQGGCVRGESRYLGGAGGSERLHQPVEALQDGAGTQAGESGQHQEGQHLEREKRKINTHTHTHTQRDRQTDNNQSDRERDRETERESK